MKEALSNDDTVIMMKLKLRYQFAVTEAIRLGIEVITN